MSLDNYIKRYTSGHDASRKMQEMYDNASNYTYEEFEEQLDKAKYIPSKTDSNVGGNSYEYQKLLDRYDDNEDRANQEFDGTMAAYRANKSQAMSDFLARKMESLPKQQAAAPSNPEPEPEAKTEPKGPVTHSPEIQQAKQRVKSYVNQHSQDIANPDSNFGYNKFSEGIKDELKDTKRYEDASSNIYGSKDYSNDELELENKYMNQQYDFSNV